ncbi:class I SAM-dependent methyltransferase [Christiangramia sp.]|uniref:class I SAM-dependent methyltransferase n=1 Tax=Christiangramia sp. TaxID=1931228 RepID=UPI00261F9596|nr:class I SAM-dependent methyltransferase [Christiangramia sp.]
MDKVSRDNKEKNRQHYNKLYADYSIRNILIWLKDLDSFLDGACATETSWHALYQDGFKDRLEDKKVMEMGCGDCVNAAMMAGLGAEVYANDIAEASGEIIKKLNQAWEFKYPIKFVKGDFLKNNLEAGKFDFVVGKAFLHHLTLPEEKEFLRETARLLKPEGEARFFEPAVNSRILDEIRWMIPVKGRPSKLNRKKFTEWKENDPHPDRSFSSLHFKNVGTAFFKFVKIKPVGTLERFNRLIPRGKHNIRYRRWAFKAEQNIPLLINTYLTRSQLIVYKEPLQ